VVLLLGIVLVAGAGALVLLVVLRAATVLLVLVGMDQPLPLRVLLLRDAAAAVAEPKVVLRQPRVELVAVERVESRTATLWLVQQILAGVAAVVALTRTLAQMAALA